MMPNLPQRQQGVALMIVIFIFALVSILSVGMYNRQSLFVQTTANILAQSQAYEYAIASEIYGRRLLKDYWDKKDDESFNESEVIKNSIMIPVEEAFLEAQFNDLQGRLNLNDLVMLDGKANPVMVKRFTRLFDGLAIETVKVDALIDWIDENQDPSNLDGIEDGEYLSLDPPYRNASQPFNHVSELLLLPNIKQSEYQELLKHLSALPQGYVSLNVNTATKEVLQSLSDNLNGAQVDSIIEQRDKEPWDDIASFKSDPLLQGADIDIKYLGVDSEFFEIATLITLADRRARLVSVIYRNSKDGVMQVLFRDQGQKYLITKEKIAL
ncbi:MAG: general secretion pathway protein K [Oleiphilaceae bacterium]|jgi:general secretion pathway protein K